MTGGTAFLRITSTYSLATSAANEFPYTGYIILYRGASTFLGDAGSTFTASAGGQQFASGALERVIAVPTGVPVTIRLEAYKSVTSGSGAMIMAGTLTVESIPFSENGDDLLGAAAAAGAGTDTLVPNVVAP